MEISRFKYLCCKKLVAYAVALSAIVTAGCTQSTEEERIGSALLEPTVSVDPTVITTSGPVSEGVIATLPSAADMSLRISSADGRYSKTWDSAAEYPLREPLRPGSYLVEAFYGSAADEGFEKPYFYGSRTVELLSGENAKADIVCRLANTAFRVDYSDAVLSGFRSFEATLHSEGGGFVNYPANERRPVYVNPGKVSVILSVETLTGQSAEFVATTLDEANAGNLYEIAFDLGESASGNPEVVLSFDDRFSTDDVVIELTPALLNGASPELRPFGFEASVPMQIVEGDIPSAPVGVTLGGASARGLTLTTRSTALFSHGWPREVDLMTADNTTLELMRQLGMKLDYDGGVLHGVDLTDVIGHLRTSSMTDRFVFTATGNDGKLAGPLTLDVKVLPAEFAVTGVSDIMMGVNLCQMKVISRGDNVADNIKVEILDQSGSRWVPAEIVAVEPVEGSEGEWTVRFHVPQQSAPTAEVRVLYCGQERDHRTVDVVSPEFSIEVDAFARYAAVRIAVADAGMRDMITSSANLYINGKKTTMLNRVPDMGLILVGGLTENTRYSFAATLYDEPVPDKFMTAPVTAVTERTLPVPNGDFEEVRDGIRYKNLPAGGRYSQNIVDIYNCQNYASYDQFVPKGWANVNAKTFCRAASNYNTWYMQPSTYSITDATSGAYAVAIESTSWDIHGEAIPDYRQPAPPYVAYSRNIPQIAHRAAGKIFLGEYGFDPSSGKEVYVEGVAFASRPTSLNGSYRFIPAVNGQSDSGMVIVELLATINGVETVIARGTKYLTVVSGYTSFTLPLEYREFGVKAERLKIMFSSSVNIGSIEEESAEVITYSDPAASTSHGGCLWIDGLTFTY